MLEHHYLPPLEQLLADPLALQGAIGLVHSAQHETSAQLAKAGVFFKSKVLQSPTGDADMEWFDNAADCESDASDVGE